MIPAQIYYTVYLLIVSVASLIVFRQYNSDILPSEKKRGIEPGFVVAFFATFFVGLRPTNAAFVDMTAYSYYIQALGGQPFEFSFDTDNILFDNLLQWWASKQINERYFFLVIAGIYFLCPYIGIRKMFPNNQLSAYLVFLAAFSTFSYATNGIKAGAAASLFIMALGFMDKKLWCVLLVLVSLGFHHSMQLPVIALLMVLIIKPPKFYYFVWVMCLLLAVSHITFFQELFGNLTDDQGAGYLLVNPDETEVHIGFRPDFVLYSMVPVLIGFKYEVQRKLAVSRTYSVLLHLYILTNAIWMLCMYAAFNNRIAYLSWFLYPIVLIYPYFENSNRDQFRFLRFRRVALLHLSFTLFMAFIYYGLFRLGH